jgi:ribonucleoside-diphosphate reductase alpha chain
VTAYEISVEEHLQMQAAFQRHVHAAVSKTINLPNDAEPSAVHEAYHRAYELGCKGVTVFRDGCRREQVLVAGQNTGREDTQCQAERCPLCETALVGTRCRLCPSCGYSRCE